MRVPWKYVSKKKQLHNEAVLKKMTQFSHYIISGYGINKKLVKLIGLI